MNKTNSNISGFYGQVLGKRVVDDAYVLCVLDGDPVFSGMDSCSIKGAVLGMIDKDTRMTLGTIMDGKTTDDHIGSDAGDDIIACIFAINECCEKVCTLELNAVVYHNLFSVDAWEHVDGVPIGRVVDCILNPRIIPWSTPTDIQPIAS